MKKILIAGAGGYIGTKMVKVFLKKGYNVIALDKFYFGDTLKDLEKDKNLKIVKQDIRNVSKETFKDVDTVINLASISNDPASDLDPEITNSINFKGAVKLTKEAKKAGVKKYIFSSSCSVYGNSEDICKENSEVNPVSIYAKSKINAENGIKTLSSKNFKVIILRLATLYGLSPKRMRFDLMVNVMTLYALRYKKIYIMGGGKQWRPLIHIDDCINVFFNFSKRNSKNKFEIFNVGSDSQNFQVLDVALKFKKFFKGLALEVIPDDPDLRNYKVSFEKIKHEIGFLPKKNIEFGIKEIAAALKEKRVTDGPTSNTLNFYKYLMQSNKSLFDL